MRHSVAYQLGGTDSRVRPGSQAARDLHSTVLCHYMRSFDLAVFETPVMVDENGDAWVAHEPYGDDNPAVAQRKALTCNHCWGVEEPSNDWAPRGRCYGSQHPGFINTTSHLEREEALRMCHGDGDMPPCPVKDECLASGLWFEQMTGGVEGGVWGGTQWQERRANARTG